MREQGITFSTGSVDDRRPHRERNSCYTTTVITISGLVGYLLFIALVSLPAWLILFIANISFPFYAVMGIVITHQLSTAFIVSAFSKRKDLYNILDFDKWS